MQKQAKSARFALIGQTLEVLESSNPSLKGLRGQAIDETRNTITIK
ncbi:ribonuclease P protein subunit, partial [Candidatus Woesearchaeota archaeon]|nr:ribonuclease P protein subunit [Candidatus Woesearchaeota archaeon]